MLEICPGFVTRSEGQPTAVAAVIFLAKSDLPLLAIANESFGSFGLRGALPGTE